MRRHDIFVKCVQDAQILFAVQTLLNLAPGFMQHRGNKTRQMRSQAKQGKSGKLRFSEGREQDKNATNTETITVCTKITIVLILLHVLLLYIRLISGNQEKRQKPPTHPKARGLSVGRKEALVVGELKTFPGRRQVQRLNILFPAPACLPGAFLL